MALALAIQAQSALSGARAKETHPRHRLSALAHATLPPHLAARLRTGAVGDDLYDGTYSILVTRERPLHIRETRIDAWWPVLAPSFALLRTPRGSANAAMPWQLFVARYWSELQSLPVSTQHTYIVRLGQLLQRYPSVTLLSTESGSGMAEQHVHAQRRVLKSWLLGESPER